MSDGEIFGDPRSAAAVKFLEELAILLGEVPTAKILAKIERDVPDPRHRVVLLEAMRRAIPAFAGEMLLRRKKPAEELVSALRERLRQEGIPEEEL